MPKNKKTSSKALAVSKSPKTKSKKVADVAKARKIPRKSQTGFSRSQGLLFIGVIGLLSGLLMFNLIVNFGVPPVAVEAVSPITLKNAAQGTLQKNTTYTASAQSALFGVTFSYPTTYDAAEFHVSESQQGVSLFKEVPAFSADGALDASVTLNRVPGKKEDVVKSQTSADTTAKQVTVAKLSATELTNSKLGSKVYVFQDSLSRVFTLFVSAEAVKSGLADTVKNSLTVATK